MSHISTFLCALSPEELPQLRPYPRLSPALLAYRIGPGPRLLRCCPATQVRGGWLGVSLGEEPPSGNPAILCRQAVQECTARGASGLLADWDRFDRNLFQLTRQLGNALRQAGLALAVPEAYGEVTDSARVLISSALSGGSLEARLSEACERYGTERVVLALERMREDFVLPSFSGQGTVLTGEQLHALRQRQRPAIYWSRELCARYFTYQAEGQVHFVLFDDAVALSKKLELAGQLGITQAIAAWAEISGCLKELGIRSGMQG